VGEVEKNVGEVQRFPDPHGKLGLRTGQSQRRDVCMLCTYMMYINELHV
jgi:hypothetical protein